MFTFINKLYEPVNMFLFEKLKICTQTQNQSIVGIKFCNVRGFENVSINNMRTLYQNDEKETHTKNAGLKNSCY